MIIEAFVITTITTMIILILMGVFDKESFIFSIILTMVAIIIMYMLSLVWSML